MNEMIAWLKFPTTQEPAYYVSDQQQKCLRGEHEADDGLDLFALVPGMDDMDLFCLRASPAEDDPHETLRAKPFLVCKHCRCLYVSKE